MEAHRADVHCFLLRPFVDEALERLGRPRVDELLARIGTDVEAIEQPDAWTSLELASDLITTLEREVDEPGMLQRCGRRALSRKYLGVIRPLFRAFGSPLFAFSQVESSTGRFNNVGRYHLLDKKRSQVRIAYEPFADAPRELPIICRVRAVNLAAIPTMFDLPEADIHEEACIHEGGAACVYRLEWKRGTPRLRSLLGLAVGSAAGGATAVAIGSEPLPSAVVLVGFSVAGWALARVTELRRELADRAADVVEQQDALHASVRMNERRYAELLEAKEEVEERVRQRTTELREASERLAAALEDLRTMSRAKEDFFANVSHELRTPLTLILAPLDDLLAGREPPGGTERALDAMQRNAARLLTLINQLLDLAKIDAGAMQAKHVPTDLALLARDVIARFESDAEARGVTLELQAARGLSPMMLDSAWIETAITNLVANAVRHARTKVAIRIGESGGSVTAEVEDDGRGMPPEDAARIFDRFARGSTGDGHVGTGLGLALVREAARLHGGEASIESTVDGGTTFRMTLARVSPPAGTASVPSTDERQERVREAMPSIADRGEGPDPDAPLALVVEDVDDLRHFIADVLAARYRVRTARNGREGLALALELRPQVVVTDVSMPEMNGLELTRALRAHDETKTVPVILVTAHRTVTSVLEGFEAGADDYVPKPFHARELLARIDVHVRLRQMVRELAHRERLATLGVVAASVAHQVRNPLTVLMSGLPAMQRRLEGSLDAKTTELLDVMLGCAGRIERMTVDLLDLSRIDREEVGLVRPGEGLAAAVRLVSAGAPPGVTIDCEVDERATLAGRAGDLNHVFLNLVDNAVRAIGDAGRVRVRGAVEGAAYVVRVWDSGPGIPKAARASIFQPFFTTRPAGEGTGLGLSIARRVVEQHGGTIEIDDPEFGGAEFVVRLPGTDLADCVVTYDARSLPANQRR